MSQGYRRGFTAAEKAELWDRWQRGESLKAIGRAFDKPSLSIYFQLAPHGGFGLRHGAGAAQGRYPAPRRTRPSARYPVNGLQLFACQTNYPRPSHCFEQRHNQVR